MCASQQSLMQQAFAHRREGDSDAVSYSTDTSYWSTPSRLRGGSNTPHYSSDFEDQTDTLTNKTPEVKSSDKCRESKPPKRTKAKKAQGSHKHKTNNNTANHQLLKLPPIKPEQVSSPTSKSANLNRIRELKSEVCDLQQQLSKARTENKMLERLQHRHTVALQHFQDSEGSIAQILTKHSNEARVLQGFLRETRTCRDNLARQLQATGNKLGIAEASLQHLQMLSQDHNLLEREELTIRLAKTTAELEKKNKRILALERNLEVCKASFNRQITTEQRKISEARKISCYLQEQIYKLTKEIQDREKELETHNIYSHRFLKGSNQKGRQSKMVQTDGLVLNSTEAANPLELQICETEKRLEELESSVNWESSATEYPETEVSVNVTSEEETGRQEHLEEEHLEETETETERCADTVEQNSCSEENPEDPAEGECTEEEETVDAPHESEEEHTEEHESQVSDILEEPLNTTEPKGNGYKPPKTKRNYTFKQTIENLHSGRPAYSSVDTKQDRMRLEGGDPQQWDL